MQIFADIRRQLYQVFVYTVCQVIYILFFFMNGFDQSSVIFCYGRVCSCDIFLRNLEHHVQNIVTTSERDSGSSEEHRVESRNLVCIFTPGFLIIFNNSTCRLLDRPAKRKQHNSACKVKNSIGVRYITRTHCLVPQSIYHSCLLKSSHHYNNKYCLGQIIQYVHHSDSFGIRIGSDGTDYSGGNAVAKINTRYNNVYNIKWNRSCL